MKTKVALLVLMVAAFGWADPIRKKRQTPGGVPGGMAGMPGGMGALDLFQNPMFNLMGMAESDMVMGMCGMTQRSPAENFYLYLNEPPESGQFMTFCQCVPAGSCESYVLSSRNYECTGATAPTVGRFSPFECCCGSKKK